MLRIDSVLFPERTIDEGMVNSFRLLESESIDVLLRMKGIEPNDGRRDGLAAILSAIFDSRGSMMQKHLGW